MNLRDQLLKAGLADKKRADEIARQKKKEERVAAGHAEDKATRERREAEAKESERREREAAAIAHRMAARAREEAEITLERPRQILRAKCIRIRPGPQRFWHKAPGGKEIWRLDLPEFVALDLRLGKLAIAWCDDRSPEVLIIDRETAVRIAELRPELILFRNLGPIDTSAAQQLYDADWDASESRPRKSGQRAR